MSSDELAIYQAKRTPPEVIKAREEKQKERHEKKLQYDISCLLNLRGIAFINPSFSKKSHLPIGWPDFTFAVNGVPCAVEVKTGNNELTPEQSAKISQLRLNGWRVEVIRDLMSFKHFLDAVKKEI